MKSEVIKISDFTSPKADVALRSVVETLSGNGLVVFPSDTVLGMMTRVSKEGVAKVNKFKKRATNKNYSLIFSSLVQLNQCLIISARNLEIIKKNTPGLFTFVVKPEKILNHEIKLLLSKEGKLGFRIPTSDLMLEIAKKCPFPILATSANLSGQPSVYSLEELRTQAGDSINNIDLIITSDTNPTNKASTVVDLSKSTPEILRKGSGHLLF